MHGCQDAIAEPFPYKRRWCGFCKTATAPRPLCGNKQGRLSSLFLWAGLGDGGECGFPFLQSNEDPSTYLQTCGVWFTQPQPNLQISKNCSTSFTMSSNLCPLRWHIYALPPHWILLYCSTHTLRFVGLFIRLARAKPGNGKQRTQKKTVKKLHWSWRHCVHVTLPQHDPPPPMLFLNHGHKPVLSSTDHNNFFLPATPSTSPPELSTRMRGGEEPYRAQPKLPPDHS